MQQYSSCGSNGRTPVNGSGTLRFRSFAARQAGAVPNVTFHVVGSGIDRTIVTDEEGIGQDISIPAPSASYSLNPDNTTVRPYSTVDIEITANGFYPITMLGVQIFDGQVTLCEPEMTPIDEADPQPASLDVVVTPTHHLFGDNQGGSGLQPVSACRPFVLEQPIIPEYITVHLGKPSASAQNVTVSFRQYIANVASSEVYPTWPEQALRANIHAQISLALNRVYTEWYPSKGYSFNITNSTSYDQYYVHNREIFSVMQQITDDIFNTYVRKLGTIDPYYTEYCDGKSVTCAGMKQWGTVTLAEQGKNALQILKYYYGDDIEIVRTNRIQAIPESYPGSPLRIGSTGSAVRTIQRQLNRIAQDYPFFGTLNVDGIFGESTAEVVKKFQKQFGLTVDGIVGRATWYKISYIYVSVKKLAELSSEGVPNDGAPVDGVYPGTSLRRGSTGASVEQIQFWLSEIAKFDDSIPAPAVDGIFGAGTEAAVRAFQAKYGLTVDGIVGRDTWEAIFSQYSSIEDDITSGGAGTYPGTPLRRGDTGDSVRLAQFYLRVIATNYDSIPVITVDGIFGSGTEAAVRAFQSFFGLSVDGVIGKMTWNKLYEVYTDVANDLLAPDQRPSTYPGTPLRQGSTGKAVRELQYYLFLLSAYYRSIPEIAFDGIFGSATTAAVKAYQSLFGLTVDGIVGPATWNSIYAQYQMLRSTSGSVRKYDLSRWPGETLQPGSTGQSVAYVQMLLQYIGFFYPQVEPPQEISNTYDEATVIGVKSFQDLFGLPQTGTVDQTTWDALIVVYLSLAAGSPAAKAAIPEEYPGYVMTLASAGPAVLQLQQYMNQVASLYCAGWFVPETGVFDEVTEDGVKQFQQGLGLPVTGAVDRETWEAIANLANGEVNTSFSAKIAGFQIERE